MRVWDIHPKHLCRVHLLAEHRELHGLWNILTIHRRKGPSFAKATKGVGYAHHPETLRWVGKRKALYERHEKLVREFARRGYKHHTPLLKKWATGLGGQKVFLNTIKEQKEILKQKPCDCLLDY